jgi:citrate synthase
MSDPLSDRKKGGSPVYLSAKEASAELGVSLATLYAYVSRGLIRSENIGSSRTKRYRGDDVRALLVRRKPAATEDKKKDRALSWGAPVMESGITLIGNNGLYYRGRDAVRLAEESSLETVATLLWRAERNPFTDQKTGMGAEALDHYREILEPLGVIERGMTIMPVLAARDPGAFTMEGVPVMKAGTRLMRVFASAITQSPLSDSPFHEVLAKAWMPNDKGAYEDIIRRALVLCADHELNASTFTVRCTASTGSSLYYAVAAGLGALKGHRHGGMSAQVFAFLESVNRQDLESQIAHRLMTGQGIPGFGHPLYETGDPRALPLLEAMATYSDFEESVALLRDLIEIVDTMTGRAPNLDLLLAGIARQIGLGPEIAIALFALGRSAGWIAHAIEQAATGRLIRPRARYTGEPVLNASP